MHIADKRFAWETISNTGKISVFDDVSCLQSQIAMHTEFKHNMEQVYVTDYANPEVLLPAEQAFFYVSPVLHSPMGGNVAAFSDNAQRNMLATEVPGQNISYQLLIQK
jgi:copper chaperone NosL